MTQLKIVTLVMLVNWEFRSIGWLKSFQVTSGKKERRSKDRINKQEIRKKTLEEKRKREFKRKNKLKKDDKKKEYYDVEKWEDLNKESYCEKIKEREGDRDRGEILSYVVYRVIIYIKSHRHIWISKMSHVPPQNI